MDGRVNRLEVATVAGGFQRFAQCDFVVEVERGQLGHQLVIAAQIGQQCLLVERGERAAGDGGGRFAMGHALIATHNRGQRRRQ